MMRPACFRFKNKQTNNNDNQNIKNLKTDQMKSSCAWSRKLKDQLENKIAFYVITSTGRNSDTSWQTVSRCSYATPPSGARMAKLCMWTRLFLLHAGTTTAAAVQRRPSFLKTEEPIWSRCYLIGCIVECTHLVQSSVRYRLHNCSSSEEEKKCASC